MNRSRGISFFIRISIPLAAIATLTAASIEFFNAGWGSGHWIGRLSLKWAAALGGFEVLCLAILGATLAFVWSPRRGDAMRRGAVRLRKRMGWLRWPLVGLLAIFPGWFFLFSPWAGLFTGLGMRLLVVSAAGLAAAWLLSREEGQLTGWASLAVGGILVGSAFALAKLLVFVSDYPFSLYWSEGNRLWEYSALFGRDLYIYPAEERIKVAIDLGRQSLGGLPFLLPGVSIWAARLWNALVFSVPYAILGWATIRFERQAWGRWACFGLWAFLFLNQGPVWAPLVFGAILVALVRRKPLWLAIPALILAGYYMEKSRTTWILAPSMWAAMLAVADGGGEEGGVRAKDWGRAALLGLAGLVGSFGIARVWPRLAQAFGDGGGGAGVGESLQSATSGLFDQVERLTTQHPLLWERLLPNATFSTGILLGLLLASLPLILLLAYLVRTGRWKLNRWQILAVAGVQLAFLAVGLVASVKVGGGTNLHNLDMFLVGLALLAGLAWEAGGARLSGLVKESSWARGLLLMVVFIPALTPMVNAAPLELPPQEKVEAALAGVQNYAACAQQYGEMLFMDQRQLLTFGYVEGVPLVVEYEKKYVMDQALAGNGEYFEKFYDDLDAGRFSLIVADRQFVVYKEGGESLAEENNAWVQWVTIPLLQRYEAVASYKLVGVELYMPAGRSYTCP